jgi:NTP pyrophosphatase (non-canonical NTP hydrolase)
MTDEQRKRWKNALTSADSAAEMALEAYPQDDQIDMVCEECAELIAAINRHRRAREDKWHVAQEIADVIIMAFQAARIYGVDITIDAIAAKSERLSEIAKEAIDQKEIWGNLL